MKNSLIILLFFVTLRAFADTASTDLSMLLKKTSSMQATFSQTILDNKNKVVQKSSGRMAMQRPGKFRWEVISPAPQLIIANQPRLWIYDQDL